MSNCSTVGASAFKGCSKIENLKINGTIATTSFSECPLKNVWVYSTAIANPTTAYTAKSTMAQYFGDAVTSFTFCVKNIGKYALYNYDSATEINFGGILFEGTIEDYAFYGCDKLTKVTGSSSTNSKYFNVDTCAFAGCNSLTDVSGRFKLAGISEFYNCAKLTDVTLGGASHNINQNSFYGCTALKTISMGPLETVLGEHAFYDCTNFTGEGMNFSNVKTIGPGAFYNCTSLPNNPCTNVKTIENSAFSGCTKLYEPNINNAETIGAYAFYNCTNFRHATDYIFPETIKTIGDCAFKGIGGNGFYNVTFSGENLQSIGKDAILIRNNLELNCPTLVAKDYTAQDNLLTSIQFLNLEGYITTRYISLGDNIKTVGKNALNTSTPVKMKEFYVDKNVSKFSTDCLKGLECQKFFMNGSAMLSKSYINVKATNLYISNLACMEDRVFLPKSTFFHMFGNGLTEVNNITNDGTPWNIPEYAFYTEEDTKLKKVTSSSKITSVGPYAFYGNKNLDDICLENATSIGSNAFRGCTGLKTLFISNEKETEKVTIGNYAFKDATGLETVVIYRNKIGNGKRGDETCNAIEVADDAFVGVKPNLLIDMTDRVNITCDPTTVVITNTETKADTYRALGADKKPGYITSIQRMEASVEDVNMDGKLGGDDVQEVYNKMK